MSSTIRFGAFVLYIVAASASQVDPIVIAATTITTSGSFDCRGISVCTGEGTHSVTIGTGTNVATLTFQGLTSTFDVTNRATSVSLGNFELEASEGFVFPTNASNPTRPMLRFDLQVEQFTPVIDGTTSRWSSGREVVRAFGSKRDSLFSPQSWGRTRIRGRIFVDSGPVTSSG